MEKHFVAKIYKLIITNGKKHINGQMSIYDESFNDLSNTFRYCFDKKRVIEFDNSIGIFIPIHISDNIFIGEYNSGPAKENADVINVDYETFEKQPKEQASTFRSLFYADLKNMLLICLDNTNNTGFYKNVNTVLNERNTRLEYLFYRNWKEKIVTEIKQITSINVKELNSKHLNNIPKLKDNKLTYVSTRFKVKITPKKLMEIYSIDELANEFEQFTVNGNNKSYDLLKESIKVSESIILDLEKINDVEYLKEKFKELLSQVSLNRNVLLE